MAEESKVLAELAAIRAEMKKATPPESAWDALTTAIESPSAETIEAAVAKSLPPKSMWDSVEKAIAQQPAERKKALVGQVILFLSVLFTVATMWLQNKAPEPRVIYIERTVSAPADAGAE